MKGCHFFDRAEFAEDCDADTVMSVNGLDYCRPHGITVMAYARRPVCTYYNNITSFCLRHVYDGRNPEHALCDLHAGYRLR